MEWLRNPQTRKAHLADGDRLLCDGDAIHLIAEHSPPKRNRRCKGCLAVSTPEQMAEATAATRKVKVASAKAKVARASFEKRV